MFTKFTKEDFIPMTWEQYQERVDIIVAELMDLSIKFDFIVPIMRGGTPLAISLSERLNVQRIIPVQYLYGNKLVDGERIKKFNRLLFSIPLIEDKQFPYNILVTEANHCTGLTAQTCIDDIKSELPNCRIYYVSIGRDYNHQDKLKGAEFEMWTFLTNEAEELTSEQCKNLDIINKFTLYPWETVEGELRDMNGD